MKKLLFINHSSSTGGAQRSLYEYLKIINKDKNFKIYILTPNSDNPLLKEFETINYPFLPQFYNGVKSYYRGFRWFLLIREIIYLILFFLFCLILKIKYKKFDMIYFNDITLIPCLVSKVYFQSKYVTALRSLQRTKKNLIYSIIKKICNKYFFKIISIDKDIFHSSYDQTKTIICRNIFNFHNFTLSNKSKDTLIVGYIGTFLKEKGIEDFYKVAKILSQKKYSKYKIKFYAIGKIPYKNFKYYLSKILNNPYYIPKEDLNNFYLLGDTNKLEALYSNISVMTFISKVKAIGRPVLEASFFKVPSIVFLNQKNSDYIINNKTGYIINENDLNGVVKKIIYLYKNKSKIKLFGKKANLNIRNKFDARINYNKFKNQVLNKI